MKIDDEFKGKDVIDDSGDKIGEINDVEWNPGTNMVESIIITEGGASATIGLGDKREISFNEVKSIGEKVLLKGKGRM
ncbi:MAG: PRC-barrel domain-containing protein [Methanobacterium sp.]